MTSQTVARIVLMDAEFTVMLYSMTGKLAVTFEAKFPDVMDGNWYTSSIL